MTLGERTQDQLNAQRGGTSKPTKEHEAAGLGIAVRPLTADEARKLEIPKGQGLLIVDVEQGKSADEAGLKVGDVILAANMAPIKNTQELSKIIKEVSKRGAIMLQIKRRGETFLRAVPLGKNTKQEKK